MIREQDGQNYETKFGDSNARDGQAKLDSEATEGKSDLVDKQKEQADYLKSGGRSGITGEFGKPVLFEMANNERFPTGDQDDDVTGKGPIANLKGPKLSVADVERLARQHGGKIDADSDGVFQWHEVDAALANPNIKGEAAIFVALLKSQQERLSHLSIEAISQEEDMTGVSQNGISSDDLVMLNKLGGSVSAADLSDHEEFRNKHDKDLKKMAAAIDEKTLEKFQKTDRWARAEDVVKYMEAVRAVNVILESGQAGLEMATSDKLFGKGANNLDSIKPEAVRQGKLPDCYFLAALASVAEQNPAAIEKMIKQRADGKFEVTFPGDKEHPELVDPLTETELALYARGSEYGLWAPALEKAFMQWQEKQECIDSLTAHDVAGGMSAEYWGLRALTPKVDQDEVNQYEDVADVRLHNANRPKLVDLKTILGKALGDNRAVTVDIFDQGKHDKPAEGFQKGHQYGVVNMFEKGGKSYVTIYNTNITEPGQSGMIDHAGDPKDGRYVMTLDDFRKTFDRMSFVAKKDELAWIKGKIKTGWQGQD